MTPKALIVKDIVKIYNDQKSASPKVALDDLSLEVPAGSIFGLLGPNGAGKSTLINILAGIVVKNSGTVSIMDIDLDAKPKAAKSLIGIVPQEVVIDSFFPLYQSLEFAAGYYGIRPKDRRTDEILQSLSLYDKRNSLPKELSGGMKRRFLIAKALVHGPKLLILDEPTAGVDIELRQQMWNYIQELHQKGTTIIITTHYLAEAQILCDHIAFINHGRIIKSDTKENLLNSLGSRYLDVEFVSNITDDHIKKISKPFEMINGNKLRFKISEANDNFNTVLGDISATGLTIRDLRVIQPDLEDVFHKLLIKK